MEVNWAALAIIIDLILVATSILAVGWMAEKRISALTVRLVALEKQIPLIKPGAKRTIVTQGYAFSEANSEKRAITLRDLTGGMCTS